jgi:hypothetical protein
MANCFFFGEVSSPALNINLRECYTYRDALRSSIEPCGERSPEDKPFLKDLPLGEFFKVF